jgi:hypothetical protein
MLRQLLLGTAVSACNVIIHALVTLAIVRVVLRVEAKPSAYQWLQVPTVMIVTVMVLMAAHICEVLVWSLCYAILDAVPAGSNRVYFAFVNYTTLGYGDVVPAPRWQLLGPMTAMNGVLLFGWSTAVIFEILRRAVRRLAADRRMD